MRWRMAWRRSMACTYTLEGYEITRLPDAELARIRNQHFGFVFQAYNLFPELTTLENVELPLVYAGIAAKARREQAKAYLEAVGLEDRMRPRRNFRVGSSVWRLLGQLSPNQRSCWQTNRPATCFEKVAMRCWPSLSNTMLRAFRWCSSRMTLGWGVRGTPCEARG
jgi:hypothetical protein